MGQGLIAMKVYVVEHCWEYEGCVIEAIFSTLELAQRWTLLNPPRSGRWEIHEMHVDSKIMSGPAS
jgi:hypothetical protein